MYLNFLLNKGNIKELKLYLDYLLKLQEIEILSQNNVTLH